MSRLLAAQRALTTPSWVKNDLSRKAQANPSLDLRFAENKSLTDATTGQNLVTFTRASSGTYVDSQGVIRTATTNLLLRSEEFDNASWVNGNTTELANVLSAPNGTLTADKLIENSGAGFKSIEQATAVSSLTYTFSVYAKAAERSIVQLLWSGGASTNFANFNLSTGTITGGTYTSATITPAGSDWFRLSITSTLAAGSYSGIVSLQTNASATRAGSYTGDGTSGLFIWGAQLEASSAVGEYVPTTSTINSAPRFDHNPTTGESLGLLVEESRTNLVRNNTMVGAVAGSPGTPPTNGWVIVNTATYASSIIGTGIENGINYIDIQYVIAAGAAAATLVYADTPAATGSTTYTGSYYLKLVSGSIPQVRFIWQDNVSTYNRSFFDITNTFTRYNDVLTTASTGSLARLAIGINASAGGTTFVIRVGMPQIEQGAFATSVIPTTTAAATRSADVASITGSNFGSWYRQDEGTVFANTSVPAVAPTTALQTQYSIHDGTTNSRITIYKRANADISTRFDVTVASVSSAFINAGTFGLNSLTASAVRVNDFAVSLNGLSAVINTTGNVPLVNQINIGSYVGATGSLNGTIRRLTYWPQRLPNNVLQSITQ